MSEFYIPLTEIEEFGGIYRARNLQGEDFRQVLQIYGRHGQSFIARAEILLVCSGKLIDGGNGTLIIFRFTFITFADEPQRRFTSAKITVEFSDLEQQMVNDPEVITILPARPQDFDIVTLSSDSELEVNVNAGTNGGPLDVGVGGRWKVSETTSKDYYARLKAVKFNNRDSFMGLDNAAIWKLEEHTSKKKGVPNLLQTAVILRRNGDGKFRMKINIETTVDKWTAAKETIKKMIGKAQPEPVDPVHIDPALCMRRDINIPELAEAKSGEIILDALDLSKYVGLVLTDTRDAERASMLSV